MSSGYLVFHSAPPIQDPPPVPCHIFIFSLENVQIVIAHVIAPAVALDAAPEAASVVAPVTAPTHACTF